MQVTSSRGGQSFKKQPRNNRIRERISHIVILANLTKIHLVNWVFSKPSQHFDVNCQTIEFHFVSSLISYFIWTLNLSMVHVKNIQQFLFNACIVSILILNKSLFWDETFACINNLTLIYFILIKYVRNWYNASLFKGNIYIPLLIS